MPAETPPEIPPALERARAETFDLATFTAAGRGIDLRVVKPRCPPPSGHEIVVCAPDTEKERLRRLSDASVQAQALPPAAVDLGDGVSLDVHLDSATMPDGSASQRIMVGAKIKF